MILAWTISDVRYRFRIRTAPLPLQGITFAIVVAVGVLALLTDLWRAEQWWVPNGRLLTPTEWQASLASAFLAALLAWAWFAFIRPMPYGKHNAMRYARAVFRSVLKGDPIELSVIADEISYSANSLVAAATSFSEIRHPNNRPPDTTSGVPEKISLLTKCANDIFLMLGDRRFCRSVIRSSPGTALSIFAAIGRTKKYGIPVETFARNIVSEAITNRDSFIFQEEEGYKTGFIGYQKPLSQSMFSNYEMAEAIGTLLDPEYSEMTKWDSGQWRAYCRAVLMTFQDFVEQEQGKHSFVLHRAFGYIRGATSNLYKLEGMGNYAWDNDELRKLEVVVKFIQDAIEILDKKGVPEFIRPRVRDKRASRGTFYDYLAEMIVDVIFSASSVRSPADWCWTIQHNTVWFALFNFGENSGAAGKVVKFKVRRLIYDEVKRMNTFANFKGARYLRYCLNVMGIQFRKDKNFKDSSALHKVILSWTKKNFAWLHSYDPRIADACLVDGVAYDPQSRRLVKTYPADGLRRIPVYEYLAVDAPPPVAAGQPAQV
jgi:hypothetical protein